MDHISVRELRNSGRCVLQRVANGETFTVTLDGEAIAELRPLSGRGIRAGELLRRWSALPAIDPVTFRSDIDAVIDASL